LEIVSNDVDTLAGLYQRMHALSFGPLFRISGRPGLQLKRTELWSASGSRWRHTSGRSCGRTSQSKDIQQAVKNAGNPARRLPIPKPDRAAKASSQS
jgi:hypothetical protein